ncbi:MAG: PDZ domain-containing protein [Deltaproteobacteria bacterium]|nr:PDZ domain-containing protein [Deltaproteobacteria bacterium]
MIVGRIRLRLGGDVITTIEGNPVSDMKQLVNTLDHFRVGQTITLGVVRDGMKREIDVVLAERP